MNFLESLHGTYGDVVYFRLFGRKVLLIKRPDLVERVLTASPGEIGKSREYHLLKSFLGEGLVTSEGALWQRERAFLSSLFKKSAFEPYGDAVTSCVNDTLRRWHHDRTIDIHSEMTELSLRIAIRLLYSGSASDNIFDRGTRATKLSEHLSMLARIAFLLPDGAIGAIQYMASKSLKNLNGAIYSLIQERLDDSTVHTDFLATLLAEYTSTGGSMPLRQVRDEFVTLFVTGHETTAAALGWTLYLLARHPQIEAEVRLELAGPDNGTVTLKNLEQFPLTQAVIKEALRLYPPASVIGRQTLSSCRLGEFQIPADTTIFLSQFLLHRDARYFPDAAAFKPQRRAQNAVKSIPRYTFLPFGAGARVCLAAAFSMYELTSIVATLVRNYSFRYEECAEPNAVISMTMRPERPIQLRLEQISQTRV